MNITCKICPAFKDGHCQIKKDKVCIEGVYMRLLRAIKIYATMPRREAQAKKVIRFCLEDISEIAGLGNNIPIMKGLDFEWLDVIEPDTPIEKRAKEIFGGRWIKQDVLKDED